MQIILADVSQLRHDKLPQLDNTKMAANTGMLHIRIDETLKEKAQSVLCEYGLTLADAVRILLTRVVAENGLPVSLASDPVSYDAWFREKVREAMEDPRPRIPHSQVMAGLHERLQTNADRAHHAAVEAGIIPGRR
jgi:DNA-damage-inducible protein J